MSIKVMAKVWEMDVVSDHTELLVLLAMADFADDDGSCFPSVRKLAKKSRISERQAYRVIKTLCDKKWLELVEKGGVRNGRNVSNRYRILLANRGTDTLSPHGPDTVSPRTATIVTDQGLTQLRQTIRHIEPSITKTIGSPSPAKDNPSAADQESSSFSLLAPAEKKTNGRESHLVTVPSSDPNDEKTAIIKALSEEFGLNTEQETMIERYPVGTLLEKAALTRSEPRGNVARYFMAALRHDFKAPKSTIPAKPAKTSPRRQVEPGPIPEPTDEELARRRAAIAGVRAAVKESLERSL